MILVIHRHSSAECSSTNTLVNRSLSLFFSVSTAMHSQHLQARRVREGVGGQPPQPVARHHQVVQLAEPAQRLVAQGRDLVV